MIIRFAMRKFNKDDYDFFAEGDDNIGCYPKEAVKMIESTY